jgi:integrase
MAGSWIKTNEPGIFVQQDEQGRPRYKYVFRDAAGRSTSRTFSRKADAEAFKAKVKTARREGMLPDVAKSRHTVAELWELTRSTSSWRPSTASWHEDVYRRRIAPYFRSKPDAEPGSRTIGSIRREDLQRFYGEIQEQSTVPIRRQAQQCVSRMFACAVEHEWLLRSPAKGIPMPDADEREPRFLTAAELAKVAAQVPPRYRALVWTLGRTGMRVGEAVALRVRNMNGSIRVVESQTEVRGYKHIGKPKTRKGERVVPISASLRETLRQHVLSYGNLFDPDSRVFTAEKGGPIAQSYFRREVFQPACRRLGILDDQGNPPTVHDLRHTAISLMLATGMQPFEIAKTVGHTNTSEIERRYGHLYESRLQAQVDRTDQLFA